jgi:small subunit ribosomal protein S21
MPGVVVGENEPFENALRRFEKQLQKSGVLGEVNKRRAYESPVSRRKGNSSWPARGFSEG